MHLRNIDTPTELIQESIHSFLSDLSKAGESAKDVQMHWDARSWELLKELVKENYPEKVEGDSPIDFMGVKHFLKPVV